MARTWLMFGSLIFIILIFLPKSDGSHYRGAMIYWKQSTTDNNTINIDYRQAWRRSVDYLYCNDTTKTQGTLLSQSADLVISSKSSSISKPFTFECTDFSESEDWTTGKGRLSFKPSDVDSSSNIFIASFASCCWIENITGLTSDSWSIITVINTTIRSDKGRMNESPRVDMPPIIRLQHGCNHTIQIPVSDDDGDDVRCRWANNNGVYDECSGVCGIFPHATIDERVNASGTWHVNIKWNPNRTDTINNVFCFTAVDTHGLSSDQRCVTMLAGVPPAVILPFSKSPPQAVVPKTQHQWSIEFDQFASPATRPAFIYLHLANRTLVETVDVTSAPGVTYTNGTHGTVLNFSTNSTLQDGKEYYLLFGQGLVQGHSYCGAESAAMLDPTFWSFRVVQMAMKEIVNVTCTATEWTVDVDMDKLRYRYPGSVATDIYLGDNSCSGILVGNHLLFNYNIQSCRTSQSTTNDNLIFTNELIYAFHDPIHPFIIRSYNWTLDITCLVLRNESTHSGVEYNQSTSVDATIRPVGAYQLKIALFTDPNYLNAIPEGAIKVPLGSQVYVKAYVDNVDWTIRMRLDTCFMSASGARDSGSYNILKDGCETDANTHVLSQSAHETRFLFSMFDLATNQGGLFLHCDAIFCDTSDPTSLPACQRPCRTSG